MPKASFRSFFFPLREEAFERGRGEGVTEQSAGGGEAARLFVQPREDPVRTCVRAAFEPVKSEGSASRAEERTRCVVWWDRTPGVRPDDGDKPCRAM